MFFMLVNTVTISLQTWRPRALLIVMACVFAVAGCGKKNQDPFSDAQLWVCTNAACSAQFTMTIRQFAKHYERTGDSQHATCPKCGQPSAIRGLHCKACGKVFPMPAEYFRGDYQLQCPFCKAAADGTKPAP